MYEYKGQAPLWSYAAHIIVVATVLCTQVDGYLVKCNGTTIYAYKNIKMC